LMESMIATNAQKVSLCRMRVGLQDCAEGSGTTKRISQS
jgi:hypothetical protein